MYVETFGLRPLNLVALMEYCCTYSSRAQDLIVSLTAVRLMKDSGGSDQARVQSMKGNAHQELHRLLTTKSKPFLEQLNMSVF